MTGWVKFQSKKPRMQHDPRQTNNGERTRTQPARMPNCHDVRIVGIIGRGHFIQPQFPLQLASQPLAYRITPFEETWQNHSCNQS